MSTWSEPSDRPWAGRQLGEFVVRTPLGAGGFGDVYLAEQPSLGREAVIKVLRLEDPTARARFAQEARLASRLDHPYAAHVYAFGEVDHTAWIAMERVRGTPLDRLLADGPMPLDQAIPLLCRLCEVVDAAHDAGIIHRDLKPANVMVVARGGAIFPKLLDLGIARDLGGAEPGPGHAGLARPSATTSLTDHARMGTPHYMAPELWVRPTTAGPACDVYALGIVAFEVLTGRTPFTGHTPMDLARHHARTPPPPLPPPLPPRLSEVIARAMGKRPADRFPTAAALAEALRTTAEVATEAVGLPRLDGATRDEILLAAPQPIAEAVAALDAARTPAQLARALWSAVDVVAAYVGVLALSCQDRVRRGDSPASRAALAALRHGPITAARWWQAARELTRSFADVPAAHPMPALVEVFFAGVTELHTAMDALLAARPARTDERVDADQLRAGLVGLMPGLAGVLRELRGLYQLPLVVAGPAGVELWMGVRRPTRSPLAAAPELPPGQPTVLDPVGRPLVTLWPLAQVAPPSAGAAPELFWFDGLGRRGAARLVAPPTGFEHHDDELPARLPYLTEADATGASAGEVTPYLGLSTFTAADAGAFFGREREVEAVVNRLTTTRVLVVVGPSGAGKSSFVQAGVAPALGPGWTALVLRPGPDPLAALAQAVSAAGLPLTVAALRADPRALATALAGRPPAEPRLLLIVDQLEEVFTLCLDPVEQDAFVNAVVAAADDDAVRVVLTLRDDFLVRAARLTALHDRLSSSLQLVTTPAAADLRRILVEPARRVGYQFEDDALPTEMAAAVADLPAALPLLSFTAFQLWGLRDRQFKQLTRAAYRALGGVGGALAQHAEATLEALPARSRAMVREAFRHLVTADGTRAVLSRPELIQLAAGPAGDGATPAAAEAVLEALIGARLLVAREGGPGGADSIEVAHEALLSAWPRLVRWRHEDAENARLRDQLRVAARPWHERGRPRGLLWRGEALLEYQLWRARYPGALTDVEEAFAAASVAEARRGRRLRRGLLAGAFAALVVALIVFARLRGQAEASRATAERSRGAAEASRATAQERLTASQLEQARRASLAGDAVGALLYLDQARAGGAHGTTFDFLVGRGLEPLAAEAASLDGHAGALWSIGYAPDGAGLATGGDDGTVRLWRRDGAARATLVQQAERGQVQVAWSPRGDRLASAGTTPIVKLWSSDGVAAGELIGHERGVASVRWSADGTQVLTASYDGTARLWDATTRRELARLDAGGPSVFAAFGPGDRHVVVASLYSHLRVFRRDGGPVRAIDHAHGDAPIWFAYLDPSGRRLASAGLDGTAAIWDVATGRRLHQLRHDARVVHVAWSPDGRRLATCSADRTIRIWDAGTGATAAVLTGHTAQVNLATWSGDGRELYSVAADGTARVWDVERAALLATYLHGGFVYAMALGPDGRTLATASWVGSGKVWDLSRRDVRHVARPLSPAPAPLVDQVQNSWSPTVVGDGAAVVVPLRDGVEWLPLRPGAGARRLVPIADGPAPTLAIAGARAAVVDAAGVATLLDLGTGAVGATTSTLAGTVAAALRPDGRALAVATPTELAVVEVSDGRIVARAPLAVREPDLEWLDAGTLIVNDNVFGAESSRLLRGYDLGSVAELGEVRVKHASPDRRWLHVGGRLSSVTEIRGKDGVVVARIEHGASVADSRWDPTGTRLIVGLNDGSVEVWTSAGWTRTARFAAHDLFVLALAVAPTGDLLATVGGDDTLKIWELGSQTLLAERRVSPGTSWIEFAEAGATLLSSDGVTIEVRSVSRAPQREALSDAVRCRLRFELSGPSIVPRPPPRC